MSDHPKIPVITSIKSLEVVTKPSERRSARLRGDQPDHKTSTLTDPLTTVVRAPVKKQKVKKAWPHKWETWRVRSTASLLSTHQNVSSLAYLRAGGLSEMSPKDRSLNEQALALLDQDDAEEACAISESALTPVPPLLTVDEALQALIRSSKVNSAPSYTNLDAPMMLRQFTTPPRRFDLAQRHLPGDIEDTSDDKGDPVPVVAFNKHGIVTMNAFPHVENTVQCPSLSVPTSVPTHIVESFVATPSSVAREINRNKSNNHSLRSITKVSPIQSKGSSKSVNSSANTRVLRARKNPCVPNTNLFPMPTTSNVNDNDSRTSQSVSQISGVDESASSPKDKLNFLAASSTPAPRRSTRIQPATRNNVPIQKKATVKQTRTARITPVFVQQAKRKRSGEDTEEELKDGDLASTKKNKKIKLASKSPATVNTTATEKIILTHKTGTKRKLSTAEDVDEDNHASSSEDDDRDIRSSKKAKTNSTSKSKKTSAKKPKKGLIAPPLGLPLGAPPNTSGIPKNALPLNGHFKLNQKSPLGVQLPVDAARTQWEWVSYSSTKIPLEQFDFGNAEHVKDANRNMRQQKIRRRLEKHGYKKDARGY